MAIAKQVRIVYIFILGVGSSFDYIVNTEIVRALASATQPDDVEVILLIDTIAQEPNETFTLTLDPITAPTPRENLFFRNTIQVTIVDSDSKNNLFLHTEIIISF